jgi:hypothetical protein
MEFIPMFVGLLFTAYIVWLAVRLVNRWTRPMGPPEKPHRPGVAWGLCVIPLLAAGLVVGFHGPVILVIIASGRLALDRTVCVAAAGLLSSALGTEWATCGVVRWWLRPFVWGLAIGAVSLLAYLMSIGWDVDLTV